MIQTNELKALIVKCGMTQGEVAIKLGMTPKTFYAKMKRGVFGSDEIEGMIGILNIENPSEIFFNRKVT